MHSLRRWWTDAQAPGLWAALLTFAGLALVPGLSACSKPDTAPAEALRFVDRAVLVPGEDGTYKVVPLDWSPGQEVGLDGRTGIAPLLPECLPLFSVPLGDVSRVVALGGTAPDTALAWSPDEQQLAVGTYRGEVLVVDGWSGTVRSRRRLAETMVKQVAWSPDGMTLYATEQSPDAFLHALDPRTLEARWSVRLADEVGSSPPPDGEDVFGVYTLPAAYQLQVLEEGDLLVGAAHGWTDREGVRHNRSRLLRIGPEGVIRAGWPDQAADATLMHFVVDEPGRLLVVVLGRSSRGPAPPDLPIGGLQLLHLDGLQPKAPLPIAPLPPHFESTFIWEALGLSAQDDLVVVGLGDGRLLGLDLEGHERWRVDLGVPLDSGGTPISASIGFGRLHGGHFVVHTSGTNVPYGSSSPSARPPSPHPGDNTLSVFDLSGRLSWAFRGLEQLNGLTLGGDGRTLVVGTTHRPDEAREDLFGAIRFRLDGGGSAAERRLSTCRTASPVFFRPVLSADGRLAAAEHPYSRPDGSLGGSYRVTVLR